MRPYPLVTLRCAPRRCFLGSVVATADGPQVLISRRVLVQTDHDDAEGVTQTVGPFSLDDPAVALQDLGCRHLSQQLDHWRVDEIREVVNAVRHGGRRAGRDYVVRPV